MCLRSMNFYVRMFARLVEEEQTASVLSVVDTIIVVVVVDVRNLFYFGLFSLFSRTPRHMRVCTYVSSIDDARGKSHLHRHR
jgi:hypothetical protein